MLCAKPTTDRANLLERAEDYKRELRFDLSEESYLQTTRTACSGHPYQKELEPIVPSAPEYNLGEARLTVNAYNALILNSQNMFVADIDQGDSRFNQFATVSNADEVLAGLERLSDFDERHSTRFADQCWRLYWTQAGFRLICVSTPVTMDWFSIALLRFLRSDPRYIDLCGEQQNFRARLTPKPWRDEEKVCGLIDERGEGVHPLLKEQLRLHDELTLEMASC